MFSRVKWRHFFVTILLLVMAQMAIAENAAKAEEAIYENPARHTELTILQQKLQDNIDLLTYSRNYLESLELMVDREVDPFALVDPKEVEQAEFNVGLAEVQVEKVRLELSSARKDIHLIESHITQYEKQLINTRARGVDNLVPLIEERLQIERKKINLEKERVKVLTDLLSVVESIYALEQDNLTQITEQLRLEQVAGIWASQQANESDILSKQKSWEKKLADYRQKLDATRPIESPPSTNQQKLLDEVAEAEEYIQVYKIQLTLSRIDALITAFDKRGLSSQSPRRNLELAERLDKLKDELVANQILVENKEILLQRQIDMLKQPGARHVLSGEATQRLEKIYTTLKAQYDGVDKEINVLMTRLTTYRNQIMLGAQQTWQTRQRLPRTLQGWVQFAQDLWVLPQVAYQSLIATYDQLIENLSIASKMLWAVTLLLIFAWTAFWLWTGRVLSAFLMGARDKGMSFSANAFIVVAQLISRNIMGITLFGAIVILLMLLQVSGNNMVVIISLGCVWFVYKIAIGLARISLFENIWDLSGSDVKLYRGLQWSLGLGSIVIALTVLAHQLPIPPDITASFDRLFMLVLLGISIPLLRGWRVLPSIIAPAEKTKPYLRRAVHWLGFLIPLTIFSNAVIGLIGYVNLAWAIWVAEGQFLLVLTAWVLARGLLGDVMETVAKATIRHLKSGWVWTEAILKPLHTILHLIIVILAFASLFVLYGFDKNPVVIERVQTFMNWPLFTMGATAITPFSLIQFVILLIVIRWAAKWSREFAYRFLFARQKDKGIRNSMAVFTQYATIIIGAFVILKVVGIDLTTLTVVLGALAVGIGFGLQGIANNLVSGILLLVERPFRAGDIITLGTHEGEVTHIGARATTIKTWDNMEVIIPNAETVSQALTNWTHHDAIVRTTFDLRVGFAENPHQAQAIILHAIRRHSSVVETPPPSVLLNEFGEFALKFQIRYFIDVGLGKSRSTVRSEVLLAIWESLRAAGIDIPYPHQTVELSELKRS